jgi:hemolysin activation/secretion protein
VIGKGQIAGLRLLLPLTMEAGFNQSLSVGMDYKDFTQNLLVSGATSQVPLTYYPITGSYQGNWTGTGADTGLTASAVLGTRGLGSDAAAFEANRAFAQPNFFYLRSAATHLHELPLGMQAWAHLQAQATPDPLVPNEQFGLGGLDTVRGYQESEVLGDNAASLQLELRSPSLADTIGVPLNELRFHAFSDLGAVSINQPLPQQQRLYWLQSVGAGLRIRVYEHFNGSLEDAVALANGSNTRGGTNRVLFRFYGDF